MADDASRELKEQQYDVDCPSHECHLVDLFVPLHGCCCFERAKIYLFLQKAKENAEKLKRKYYLCREISKSYQ
jgi:hypothetical protein